MDQKELENNYKQKTSMTSIRMSKQMRNKKGNKTSITKYILISLFVLAIAILIGALTNIILSVVYKNGEPVEHIVGMLEGIIGAIATGLVLYQLKIGEKTERHQNDIEEASFILQYNQSFIQDANMTEVEHLLERQVDYDVEPDSIITDENRQKFINYLVYLEGMALLILNGVLTLDYIDNLMAYRFSLAMDNVEVQNDQLILYAEYYRGCYRLYKMWKEYRDSHDRKYPKDDCKNKDTMRALCTVDDFEKYATN